MIAAPALAALALACAVPAHASTPAARIRLEVEPARVLLGTVDTVRVVARVVDAAGIPVTPDAPPVLLASTGTPGAFSPAPPGAFHATWTPPAARHPHVAFLLAHARVRGQPVVGSIMVPLWGRGRLRVDTKPGAMVTVVLGDAQVGPVAADAAGRAYLDVEAPPGPTRATAESVDRLGNESRQSLDLGVPPFNHLALFQPWPPAAGERGSVLVAASTGRGTPRERDGLTVRVDGAPLAVEALEPLQPGLWLVPLPARDTAGARVVVEARLADTARSTATVTVPVVAGGPRGARLVAERSGAFVLVSADVVDASGAPVDAGAVELRVGGKPSDDVRRPRPQTLRARLRPPPGAASLDVEAVLDGRILAGTRVPIPPDTPRTPQPDALLVGPSRPAGAPFPPRSVAFSVRGTRGGGDPGAPGPLVVTSADGVEVLALRATPDETLVVAWPAPGRGRAHADITVESPTGARAVVRVETVPLPALERWASLQVRSRLHVGGLLYAGAGVDAGFSWPLPLGIHPFRLGLRVSALAASEAALPFSPRLPPVNGRRLALGAPALAFVGMDGGWGPWRAFADLGAGAWTTHLWLAPRDAWDPWPGPASAPWKSFALLGGAAPMVAARAGGALHVGRVRMGTELMLDAGWLMGRNLQGPAGGITPALTLGISW